MSKAAAILLACLALLAGATALPLINPPQRGEPGWMRAVVLTLRTYRRRTVAGPTPKAPRQPTPVRNPSPRPAHTSPAGLQKLVMAKPAPADMSSA